MAPADPVNSFTVNGDVGGFVLSGSKPNLQNQACHSSVRKDEGWSKPPFTAGFCDVNDFTLIAHPRAEVLLPIIQQSAVEGDDKDDGGYQHQKDYQG